VCRRAHRLVSERDRAISSAEDAFVSPGFQPDGVLRPSPAHPRTAGDHEAPLFDDAFAPECRDTSPAATA